MKENNKSLVNTVFAIGVLGLTAFGGVTLFGINFNETYEAQRLPTREEKMDDANIAKGEKKDNADLDAKNKGDSAMNNGDYLKAIHFYSAISDDSAVVSNKMELVDMATEKYISYTLSEVDHRLDNDDFNQSRNLIKEALKEVYENEELSNKLAYVSLREELHSLTVKEKPETIINFINDRADVFGNDKKVTEIYVDAKNDYLSNVISDSNKSIENHEYDAARNMLDSAEELIGTNSKISDQRININKKEIDYNISSFKNKEDWYGLYQYINSLDEALKNDKNYDLKGARNKLIDTGISTSKKYLKEKNYDLARTALSDLVQIIGNDDKIDSQYELIDKTIIQDNISEIKSKELWRNLIDYLNGLSDIDNYKSDYSNAVTKYKASILDEAKELIQSGDYDSAYNNVLLPAYDILSDDEEYIKLYEECSNGI